MVSALQLFINNKFIFQIYLITNISELYHEIDILIIQLILKVFFFLIMVF